MLRLSEDGKTVWSVKRQDIVEIGAESEKGIDGRSYVQFHISTSGRTHTITEDDGPSTPENTKRAFQALAAKLGRPDVMLVDRLGWGADLKDRFWKLDPATEKALDADASVWRPTIPNPLADRRLRYMAVCGLVAGIVLTGTARLVTSMAYTLLLCGSGSLLLVGGLFGLLLIGLVLTEEPTEFMMDSMAISIRSYRGKTVERLWSEITGLVQSSSGDYIYLGSRSNPIGLRVPLEVQKTIRIRFALSRMNH